MKKILFSTLLAVALVAVSMGSAHAYSTYLSAFNTKYGTSWDCGVCHNDNVNGGGPRNPYGTAFGSNPNHSTTPATAFDAISTSASPCSGYTFLAMINQGLYPGGHGSSVTCPTPVTCTSFTYNAWGTCTNGTQTRTVATSSPSGCTGGSPVTSQSCTTPCTSYTYTLGACQSNNTAPVLSSVGVPSGCSGGATPATTQPCTYTAPTCTSFTYNAWGTCTNGTQTRTVATSSPSGCTGGSPVTSQPCTSTQPCTSYTYTWGACQPNGTQTATSTTGVPSGCSGGATPVTTQSCTYTAPTCTSFTYNAWGACQSDGTQTRTVASSSPSGCTGGSPVTSQTCTYVPPPTGEVMPLPTNDQTFPYRAVAAPVLSTDPSQAKPIGVGAVATGGSTFDITIGLDKFAGPVDVAFAVYAASIDPRHAYYLGSDHYLRTSRVVWKTSVMNLSDAIALDVPISSLPSGQYTLMLQVSSAGTGDDDSDNNYYRWVTSFSVKSGQKSDD